jgi:hypothetical protein
MGHRRVYTIAKMEADIRAAGLRTVRQAGFLYKPLPQGMLAALPEAVLDGFMKLGDEMPTEYAAVIGFDCALLTDVPGPSV